MKYDLEERLINYSVLILDIVEAMPANKGANHLASQIIRSGTAPALMYGEAQSSESRKDFIHKMRLPLKELRETYNCLKIIDRKWYAGNADDKLNKVLKESHELISIFVKSIGTAIENSKVKT
jgi:four helix bundle protein